MHRTIGLIAAAVLTASCTAPHPALNPEFEPLADNQFRYEAGADRLFQQADDPDAEARRMERLQEYLDQNHYCLKGYTITERKPVAVDEYITRIFYKGVCT